MSSYRRSLIALSLVFIAGASGACSGDGDVNDARLSIIGEEQVFARGGTTRLLRVRYHDGDNRALAGEVSFSLSGETVGTTLAEKTALTDGDGEATVELHLGEEGEGLFEVIAEAKGANAARWTVALTKTPFEVTGRYELESQFTLPEELPGGALFGLDAFRDATDGANDPATWLLDSGFDAANSGGINSFDVIIPALRDNRAILEIDRKLNELLIAEGAQADLEDLADDVNQVVRTVGVESRLTVAGDSADGTVRGVHEYLGSIFWVDEELYAYDRQAMNLLVELDEIEARDIGFSFGDNDQIEIGEHTIRLPYGNILSFAIDNVIVPKHQPLARSLGEVVATSINCDRVGEELFRILDDADELGGLGGASAFADLCRAAIDQAVILSEDTVTDVEADLTISGVAKLIDGDDDLRAERFHKGMWEGEMVFNSGGVILDRPDQKFTGTRKGE